MAKWNEGLRIEEALGAGARLARPFATNLAPRGEVGNGER
jgi:hypothetical protein